MKTLAIILVSLCVFAHATSVFQAPAFLQMKTNAFGSAIGSMIEMNMNTENPSGRLNAVQELLNQVEENLDEQDASALQDITEKRDQCSSGQAALQGLIDSLKAYIANLYQEQGELQAEQAQKEQDVVANNDLLASAQQQLRDTQDALAEENSSWEVRNNEYLAAIDACERSLVILDTLNVNTDVVGFVQMKSKFAGVASLLSKNVPKTISSFIQPIVTVLTDLSNSTLEVDQDQLGRVVELISDLLAQLRQQRQETEDAHHETVSQLEGIILQVSDLIAATEALLESLANRLGEIAVRLATIADLLVSNQANLEIQELLLSELVDKCNGYEADYAYNFSLREGQHDLLARIQEYFTERVVPAVQNVRDENYEDSLTV